MKAQRAARPTALPIHNLGAKRRWGGQCPALAALPPRKRPGTYHTGDWEDLGAGVYGYRKSRPHWDSNLDHLTCSESLY